MSREDFSPGARSGIMRYGTIAVVELEGPVIKVVSTFRLTPDRPREQADAHYLQVHVPMVTGILAGIEGALGYVQNRVTKPVAYDFNGTEPKVVEPIFDWLVEFWFEGREARLEMAEHPKMVDVMADHPNFMDVNTERCMEYYVVAEHVAIWRPGVRVTTI